MLCEFTLGEKVGLRIKSLGSRPSSASEVRLDEILKCVQSSENTWSACEDDRFLGLLLANLCRGLNLEICILRKVLMTC